VRGGSWNNNNQNTRAAYRNNNNPNNRNNNIGFRVAEPLSLRNRKCGWFTDRRRG
jgi:formylglycine-generating enzyme required for sulfatase activity